MVEKQRKSGTAQKTTAKQRRPAKPKSEVEEPQPFNPFEFALAVAEFQAKAQEAAENEWPAEYDPLRTTAAHLDSLCDTFLGTLEDRDTIALREPPPPPVRENDGLRGSLTG